MVYRLARKVGWVEERNLAFSLRQAGFRSSTQPTSAPLTDYCELHTCLCYIR